MATLTDSIAVRVSLKWGGGFASAQKKTINAATAPSLYAFGTSGRFINKEPYIQEIAGILKHHGEDLSKADLAELSRLTAYCTWRQKLYDL